MRHLYFVVSLCFTCVAAEWLFAGQPLSDQGATSGEIPTFVAKYCADCHLDGANEGEMSLDDLDLSNVDVDQREIWGRILETLKFGQMPPAGETQPSFDEMQRATLWMMNGLEATGYASDIEHRLRQPAYANLLSHEKLFDGSVDLLASSPPRLWRLHPEAYENVLSSFGRELRFGGPLSKPFTVGDDKGLASNYAELMQADAATLSQLMLNCQQIAKLQTTGFLREEKDRKTGGIVKKRHRRSPDAFVPILESLEPPTDEQLRAAITAEFEWVLGRAPRDDESAQYLDLAREAVEIGGNERGLKTLAMAVLLRPEAIFRMEVGLGEATADGRRMLSPHELAYAIAYALTDTPPDKLLLGPPREGDRQKRPTPPSLLELAEQGELRTRDDVRRVVTQILQNDGVAKPRILRFFREFFGYHHAETVFKGDRAGREFAPKHLVKDADDLVLHHVREDRQVLKELLTTERFFVYWPGSLEDYQRRIDYITQRIKPDKKNDANYLYFIERAESGLRSMPQANPTWRKTVRFYNLDEATWDYPLEQPFEMPTGERVGILTHPAWLAAWSGNSDNDPIRRGKWIREHLLAGSVPDVPITADASVPEDPHKTLRERLEKTRADSCWKCHQRMDPLGFPFEAYDDFGQYRTEESLGHTRSLRTNKETRPVVTSGAIVESGNAQLDGPVQDVRELMHRLAQSRRVQQSFVRHAFRYWLGRNESLSDSSTLIAAEAAYANNDGSFQELLISLLTSDSFLYRK